MNYICKLNIRSYHNFDLYNYKLKEFKINIIINFKISIYSRINYCKISCKVVFPDVAISAEVMMVTLPFDFIYSVCVLFAVTT